MKKAIFLGVLSAFIISASGSYACVFADDPAHCRKIEHCDEQGWLYPFCYMGATNNQK